MKENSVDRSVDESQGWDHTGKFQHFAADLNSAKEHVESVATLLRIPVQLQVEMVKKSLVAWEEETGARSQDFKSTRSFDSSTVWS